MAALVVAALAYCLLPPAFHNQVTFQADLKGGISIAAVGSAALFFALLVILLGAQYLFYRTNIDLAESYVSSLTKSMSRRSAP